jgi:hypothetical protein
MRTSAGLLLAALLLSVPSARAEEVRLPWESPAARVALTVGITDVEIVYYRPGVKGRQVWGGLVPYGEVWRLGANEATRISFSHPVQLDGHDVPAGTYALFAIPGPDRWTLVLNKKAQQWGAYFYKLEEDQLRFDVQPRPGEPVEWMELSLTPASESSAVVEMAWDKLRVPFTVSVDVDGIVWADIDRILAGEPTADAYLAAARYAQRRETRLDDAMVWLDKSLALQEGFWAHETKAILLQGQGQREEAFRHLDRAMELARGKAPQAYIDGLEKLKAEWSKREG